MACRSRARSRSDWYGEMKAVRVREQDREKRSETSPIRRIYREWGYADVCACEREQ